LVTRPVTPFPLKIGLETSSASPVEGALSCRVPLVPRWATATVFPVPRPVMVVLYPLDADPP
jgi:hypothetical protein